MNKYNLKFKLIPLSNNLTKFESILSQLEQIRYIENPYYFYKETAYNKKVDGKYSYYYILSKIKFKNDNRSTRYLTHGIDFYKGNFQAQMIRGLINYCNLKKNSLILDLFCGSGTTLVEAKLLGFDCIGIDVNPIACLNSLIKTGLLEISLDYLIANNSHYFNLDYYLKYKNNGFNNILNLDVRELFYIFLFTRALSDEHYVFQNRKVAYMRNYNQILNLMRIYVRLKKLIDLQLGDVKVINGDNLFFIEKFRSNRIDLILTSPPYLDVIDYIDNDLNQIKFFLNEKQIGNLKIESIGNKFKSDRTTEIIFWMKISTVIKEAYRILKSNSYFILIIGYYKHMKKNFILLAKKQGFHLERILEREVINFKKSKSIEYVLFFKKI